MPIELRQLLNYTLAALYDSQNAARMVVINAGLKPQQIDFSGSAVAFWSNILEGAEKHDRLGELIDAVLLDYPNHADLLVVKKAMEEGFDENYALIQGNYVALGILPAAFLDLGVHKAKSVCRVTVHNAAREVVSQGTGFLLKDDLLVTVSFLVPDAETARNCTIEFEYEQSLFNATPVPTKFSLDPDAFLLVREAIMCTVVKVKDRPSDSYPVLKLRKATANSGGGIIMVHHRQAWFKQVSLWDGPVTYAGNDAIRYRVKASSPGAAGAPVFNLGWQVTGMHYAARNDGGGWEGKAVPVEAIVEALRKAGLNP